MGSPLLNVMRIISRMQILLSCFLFFAFFINLVSSECCSQRVVTGAGSDLDGTYDYKEDKTNPVEDVCADGCVYTKAGATNEEFCFQSAVLSADTEVTCDPSTERNVPISSTPLLIGKATQKNFKIFSIN